MVGGYRCTCRDTLVWWVGTGVHVETHLYGGWVQVYICRDTLVWVGTGVHLDTLVWWVGTGVVVL